MLAAWYYDPPGAPRRVAAVSARPDGCFTRRQVLSDVDRDSALDGARVAPGGTAVGDFAPARQLSEPALSTYGPSYVAANERGEVAVTWSSSAGSDQDGNAESHPVLVRGRLGR
jgi:hypothetical protein